MRPYSFSEAAHFLRLEVDIKIHLLCQVTLTVLLSSARRFLRPQTVEDVFRYKRQLRAGRVCVHRGGPLHSAIAIKTLTKGANVGSLVAL